MALAERAELIARLTLQDNFSGPLGKAQGKVSSLGKIGQTASRGLQTAAANLTGLGVAASGFVALNVQRGIQSLAELEDATTAVDGAIEKMGLTGKVTSGQIATWANEIEASVQAAFDDKEIVAATSSLLRIGKVTEENIRPAMEVLVDFAATTGQELPAASKALARALAAPEKAAGRLQRAGITLTEQQQKQIETMVEAGDVAGAQAKLLEILTETTEGAAKASKGPFNDAMLILRDTIEDVQRILGMAFLPVLSKVSDKLSTALADKGFRQGVKDFGETIAGAFDKVLEIGGKIPWDQIGNSLKIAGTGAKAVFDAFTMLPPWVQTAVLTGWGLNKLTGGALGSIVGELGKGIIKGVMNMNAGVVNIKAGAVTGGGAPVSGGKTVVGGGGIGTLGKFFLAGEAIGLILAVNSVREAVQEGNLRQAQEIGDAVSNQIANNPTQAQLQQSLAGIDQGLRDLGYDPVKGGDIPILADLIAGPTIRELIRQREQVVAAIKGQGAEGANKSGSPDERQERNDALQKQFKPQLEILKNIANASRKVVKNTKDEPNRISDKERARFTALRDKIESTNIRTNTRVDKVERATQAVRTNLNTAKIALLSADRTSRSSIVSAERSAASAIVAAIRANRPIVNVSTSVSVSGSGSNSYATGSVVRKSGGGSARKA